MKSIAMDCLLPPKVCIETGTAPGLVLSPAVQSPCWLMPAGRGEQTLLTGGEQEQVDGVGAQLLPAGGPQVQATGLVGGVTTMKLPLPVRPGSTRMVIQWPHPTRTMDAGRPSDTNGAMPSPISPFTESL